MYKLYDEYPNWYLEQDVMADKEGFYMELEQYLACGEPRVEEHARNWSMAIGLQDVDRLKTSEFLLELAKAY